jgi:hypothetical protein
LLYEKQKVGIIQPICLYFDEAEWGTLYFYKNPNDNAG